MRKLNTGAVGGVEGAPLRCAHHVPGRLRLQAAESKGNEAALRTICRRIGAIPGIAAATASPVTGSNDVLYEPHILPPQAIEARLRALGLLSRAPERAGRTDGTWGDRLAEAAVRKLVGYAVEALTFAALDAL